MNGTPDDTGKEGTGMKIRLALQCGMAGLVLCACVAAAPAAAQDLQKTMAYDDYAALPKLEIATEEVGGTFTAAKIEYVSFREVEGVDRYQMTGITAKGRASGMKPLVQDYRKVRIAAKGLMTRLCGKKKAVVESDLLYPDHFTTQFRCQ
jgi:hypothetical protein